MIQITSMSVDGAAVPQLRPSVSNHGMANLGIAGPSTVVRFMSGGRDYFFAGGASLLLNLQNPIFGTDQMSDLLGSGAMPRDTASFGGGKDSVFLGCFGRPKLLRSSS